MSNKNTDIKSKWFNNLDNINHNKELLEKLIKNDAEEMVRKSGQQGVPQTNINGQVVVGFDKEKINKLLGIEA